jgi:hypothetical protein
MAWTVRAPINHTPVPRLVESHYSVSSEHDHLFGSNNSASAQEDAQCEDE